VKKNPTTITVYAVHYAHPNCAYGTTSHTPKTLYAI